MAALSPDERSRLRALAIERGDDPDEVMAEVEAIESAPMTTAGSSGEPPKLFMYLLPFVRVREVRGRWLGLTDPFPGDDEVAAAWAAKMAPVSGPTDDEE